MLGGKRGDKGGHLAGGAQEHVVVQRWKDRTAHSGGHAAEGMGVRAGGKGGVQEDVGDELDREVRPDVWGEGRWGGRGGMWVLNEGGFVPQGRGGGLPGQRAPLRGYALGGGGSLTMIRRRPVDGDHGFVVRRMDMEGGKLRTGDAECVVHEDGRNLRVE